MKTVTLDIWAVVDSRGELVRSKSGLPMAYATKWQTATHCAPGHAPAQVGITVAPRTAAKAKAVQS